MEMYCTFFGALGALLVGALVWMETNCTFFHANGDVGELISFSSKFRFRWNFATPFGE